jgi:DNA-binding MarR family transcriptional regulator
MILLNSKGRKLFAGIMKKDEEVIEILFSQISKKNIRITQQTLQGLLNKLS